MGSLRVLSGFILASFAFFAASSVAQAEWSFGTSSLNTTLRAPFGCAGAEFMSLEEVEAALPLAASRKFCISLSWPSTEIDNPAYYELVRRAQSFGVEMRPWLLLPIEKGYWPNSVNALDYDLEARRLIDRWLAEGLKPTTFVVDMEPPFDRVRGYANSLQSRKLEEVIRFLRAGINREQYATATRVFADLVDHAHKLGFRVELTTISQVLDDYLDGDDGLRQAFNIPVAGINWDLVGIQVYRTLNEAIVGAILGPTSPYYVYEYAQRARVVFGRKAIVAIGLIEAGDLDLGLNEGEAQPVYRDGRQLREDIDAARAAGYSRDDIGVYSLRGIVHRTPSEQWFPTPSLLPFPPRPDLPTVVTRTTTQLLDAHL